MEGSSHHHMVWLSGSAILINRCRGKNKALAKSIIWYCCQTDSPTDRTETNNASERPIGTMDLRSLARALHETSRHRRRAAIGSVPGSKLAARRGDLTALR
jgi:hypothetical protein